MLGLIENPTKEKGDHLVLFDGRVGKVILSRSVRRMIIRIWYCSIQIEEEVDQL